MRESERLERFRLESAEEGADWNTERDLKLKNEMLELLDHPKVDKYCLVDACYYDYSILPDYLKDRFFVDMYLIYGITVDGELVSKWVERYDLDW